MATVYLARKPVVESVTRDYALKLMHAHLRGDPEWATHLLHEARIAARIRHPNVVQVLEAGDDPLGLFLVLEYIEGDTLSGLSRLLRQKERQLPLPISGRILLDALGGLHAAHELHDDAGAPLGLVHRDFSPQNVLIGLDGISRLTDFGIAKAAGGQMTATGVLKGKFSYMSPEQARGQRLDRRSDVWAAGVIAWELIARRRLYPSRNDADTLLAVVSQPPPPLDSIVSGIPPRLSSAVASALTFDVDRRCPDARELGERLAASWAELGGIAEPAEVADFVRSTTAESLASRRRQIERVLARRGGASVSVVTRLESELGSEPSAPRSTDSLVLGVPTPVREDGTTAFQLVTSTKSRRRAVAFGAGGALAVAAVVAVLAFRARTIEPNAVAPAAIASVVPAPAAASASSAPPRVSATLVVRANRPLSRVRVGRRKVDIEQPASEAEIELLGDEIGKTLQIEATSTTGQVMTAEVGQRQGTASIQFPDPPRTPAVRGRPPPKRPPPADDLAPTPFR